MKLFVPRICIHKFSLPQCVLQTCSEGSINDFYLKCCFVITHITWFDPVVVMYRHVMLFETTLAMNVLRCTG